MRRWIFNGTTLVSMFLFLGGLAIWHRSYTAGHEWQMAPVRAAPPSSPAAVASLGGTWTHWRWIGYSNGRVQCLERTVFDGDAHTRGPERLKFWVVGNPDAQSNVDYVFDGGNWLIASIRFYSTPAKVVVGHSAKNDPPPPFVIVQPKPPSAPSPDGEARRLAIEQDLRSKQRSYQPLLNLERALMDEEMYMHLEFRQLTEQAAIEDWLQREEALALRIRKNEAELATATDRVAPKPPTAEMNDDAERELLQSMARTGRIVQQRAAAQAQQRAAYLQRAATTPLPVPGTRTIVVSMWLLILPTLILPLLWTRSTWRRGHQRQVNSCRACGYDIRATPQQCPECGTVPADKPPGAR